MKKTIIIAFTVIIAAVVTSCSHSSKKYVIGVSQCSEDSWRTKLKAELEQSTYFNEDVELRMLSAPVIGRGVICFSC